MNKCGTKLKRKYSTPKRIRKAYDKHEDHRDVGGKYLASKPKRVPAITFVAQRERAADKAADNLDHRVKGEEGGQQINPFLSWGAFGALFAKRRISRLPEVRFGRSKDCKTQRHVL